MKGTGVDFKRKRKKAWQKTAILFCCLLFPYTALKAEADFSDYETATHPLIQATGVVEEYEALVRLGFFNTGVWKVRQETEAENVEGQKGDAGEAGDERKYESENQMLFRILAGERAYDKARAAVVEIDMGMYYGSGILWDVREGNLVIVSNAHLLEEGDSGKVLFCSGISAEGTVTGTSDTRDIGFLEVPLLSLEREDWMLLRFADKDVQNYHSLLAGDEIFVVGSANGAGQDYYEGTIGNVSYYFPEFQSDMLYGYCKAMPGMSGGGTFDMEGHFIGMLTAGTEGDEIASLPVGIMVEEYKRIYGNGSDRSAHLLR